MNQRPIKFREWDKLSRRMLHTVTLQQLMDEILDVGSTHSWHMGALELMQFTGLLDIDGKEIYEGDIVSRPGTETNEVIVEVVSFEEGKFVGVSEKYDTSYLNNNYGEIIGNIYENPELLESARTPKP